MADYTLDHPTCVGATRERPTRHGTTLIELLVVVSILVLLTLVALPTMKPALESRRIREAARALNIYLGSARARAMESGRPCGVVIRRWTGNARCAIVLDQAEVPPPYAGAILNAMAAPGISAPPNQQGFAKVAVQLNDPVDPNLVNPGDLVQLNYQGPLYTNVTPQDELKKDPTKLTLEVYVGQQQELQQLPWVTQTQVPYQIFRRPVKSAAASLQLPAATVIDLDYSGTDSTTFSPANPPNPGDTAIYIMFAPNGSVERFWHWHPIDNEFDSHPAIEPIYLLVGKREQVGTPAGTPTAGTTENLANWQILSNLWIAINPQTGLVSTSEIIPADSPQNSRQLAKQAQTMGGR